MLTLTREAVDAIRQLTQAANADGVRIHAGTRRFSRGGAPSIQVEVAPWPDVEDTVLEVAGVRLFLDPDTLRVLDEKVLDAEMRGGEPRFLVHLQPSHVRV
jgi:iron-sulfur cluster assembly protein